MADNKIIHYIPPLPPKREKRVGIYCRVSTNSEEQLKSHLFHDINNPDAIIECILTPEPDFEDQVSLIDIIDQGVEKFITTISESLSIQNQI